MSLREVRRRCQTLLDDNGLARPFDADVFRRAVERRRRRPIKMVPRDQMVGPCGVLISLPETDYVFYEAATSKVHRDHIIAHELGHLLCDHASKERFGDELIRTLLPDLDPATVRNALGRRSYSDVDEQEAEMIASLAVGRPQSPAPSGDPIVRRLHRSLGAAGG